MQDLNIRDGYLNARGIQFHYLEGGEPGHGIRVVYVPGYLADAGWFKREMVRLAPRHTISLNLRGRGKSEAPTVGYGFEDHVADLEAILGELDLPPFCLIAFSRGVSYALGYAFNHLDRIKGLILQDSDPVYYVQSTDWVKQATTQMPHIPRHVVDAISRESSSVSLWESLSQIKCPVLIMRGSNSSLSAEAARRYEQYLPHSQVVVFEGAGHLLWEPDFEAFYERLEKFINSLS